MVSDVLSPACALRIKPPRPDLCRCLHSSTGEPLPGVAYTPPRHSPKVVMPAWPDTRSKFNSQFTQHHADVKIGEVSQHYLQMYRPARRVNPKGYDGQTFLSDGKKTHSRQAFSYPARCPPASDDLIIPK